MNNISKNDIAVIGIRILAIAAFLQWINTCLGNWLISLRFDLSLFNFSMFLLLIVPLSIPLALWIFSGKIAGFMTKTKLNEKGSKGFHDLQAILFCAIGVFIFITNLPKLIAWIYMLTGAFMRSHEVQLEVIQFPQLETAVLLSAKLILSLILMFTAKSLSRWFYKLRYAGSDIHHK